MLQPLGLDLRRDADELAATSRELRRSTLTWPVGIRLEHAVGGLQLAAGLLADVAELLTVRGTGGDNQSYQPPRPRRVEPRGDALTAVPARLQRLAGRLELDVAALSTARLTLPRLIVVAEADALETVLTVLGNIVLELHTAAENLARVTALPSDACLQLSGACPQHGATLAANARYSWCRWCGRRWSYDRTATACPEPAVATYTTAEGSRLQLCTGHLVEVRRHGPEARIALLHVF